MEMVSLYLIAANVAGFALMALDKFLAQTHSRRVPERTLFGVALLGGSLGAWAGMYACRHKTKHWYFVVGMPLILVIQLLLAALWGGGYVV